MNRWCHERNKTTTTKITNENYYINSLKKIHNAPHNPTVFSVHEFGTKKR